MTNNGGKLKLHEVPQDFTLDSLLWPKEQELVAALQSDESFQERMGDAVGVSDNRIPHRLLGNTLRATEAMTPVLWDLLCLAKTVLREKRSIELFLSLMSSPNGCPNGMVVPSSRGRRAFICIDSRLIEPLTPRQVLFVLGHELGHFVMGHHLLETDVSFESSPYLSLPEILQLKQISRYREVIADRVALLCCQELSSGLQAIFHTTVGLSTKWVSFSAEEWNKQIEKLDELQEATFDVETAKATHPFPAMRARALIEFAESDLYQGIAGSIGKEPRRMSEVNRSVEHVLAIMDDEALPQMMIDRKDNLKTVSDNFLYRASMLACGADGKISRKDRAVLTVLNDGDVDDTDGDIEAFENDEQEGPRLFNDCLQTAEHLTIIASEFERAHLWGLVRDAGMTDAPLDEAASERLSSLLSQLQEALEVSNRVLNSMPSD